MAWRSSGTTNASLVAALLRNSLLDPAHQAAMLAIDRADYAPTAPYEDAPQPLGFGATISAPHMHAMALAQLRAFARPGAQVLDVGSGSGYLTAVLGELVKPGGRVLGIEHVPELVALAEGNMRKSLAGSEALESGRVRFELGDGRLGVGGPWDAIHVGAAADDEVVDRLVATLGVPGRLFIPVKDDRGDQHIWVVDKESDGSSSRQRLCGVRYVPLTSRPESEGRE